MTVDLTLDWKEALKLLGFIIMGTTGGYLLWTNPVFDPYGRYLFVFLVGAAIGNIIELHDHLNTLTKYRETVSTSLLLVSIINGITEVSLEQGYFEEANQRAQEHQAVMSEVIQDMEAGMDHEEVHAKYDEYFEDRQERIDHLIDEEVQADESDVDDLYGFQ